MATKISSWVQWVGIKFPSPERVVSDYIKNCFKTDLPWFSRIDPDNAYFICFSQTGVIADLILDGIILGNIKQKYWHSLKPLLLILVIVLMFLMMQIQAQEFIKQRVQMCLTKKMKKKCSRRNTCIFYKKCDFAGVYGKTLSDYWSKYYDKFKLLLKNYYISSALYLYKNGELDEREYNFSMNALNRSDNISLLFFDIYGYYASDIFVAKNNDKVMLFIPGAKNLFYSRRISLICGLPLKNLLRIVTTNNYFPNIFHYIVVKMEFPMQE